MNCSCDQSASMNPPIHASRSAKDEWILSASNKPTWAYQHHLVLVGIDLHQLAQRPTGPLTSRPDRGPSPRRGRWAPVAQPIKRRWGLTAQVMRFAAATVPHLKTLTRSERVGCSSGKRHRAITDASDPRRSSTGVAAIVLDTATTSSLRVAALAQILSDVPAVAPGERK